MAPVCCRPIHTQAVSDVIEFVVASRLLSLPTTIYRSLYRAALTSSCRMVCPVLLPRELSTIVFGSLWKSRNGISRRHQAGLRGAYHPAYNVEGNLLWLRQHLLRSFHAPNVVRRVLPQHIHIRRHLLDFQAVAKEGRDVFHPNSVHGCHHSRVRCASLLFNVGESKTDWPDIIKTHEISQTYSSSFST